MQFIPKVDSCKISIRLDYCKIIDPNLIEYIFVQTINQETGEVIKETEKRGEPYIVDGTNNDGLKWKISYDRSQIDYERGNKISREYLTILLNSKLLKDKYFKGITSETLRDIYNTVMAEKVFYCTFEAFKYSRYNDTDICFDFISEPEKFEQLKKNIRASVLDPTKFHSVNKIDNSGIWAPTRSDPRKQASPKHPFIKFYSKELDMKGQSSSFAQAYLKESDYLNKYRCEVTVKNAEHKKRLGIDNCKTLWEFLNLDLQSIMHLIVRKYFVKNKRIKTDGLTPSQYIMLNLMNKVIEMGGTKKDLIDSFDLKKNGVAKKSRHNAMEQYHKIMSSENLNTKQLELNETTENVFEFLGIETLGEE